MERLESLNIKNRGLVTALFAYDDMFLDRGLKDLTLEQALHIYLKRNGYKTIVFYNTKNGFYSFETKMLSDFLSKAEDMATGQSSETPQTPQDDVVVDASPAGHSTGRRRFTRRRQQPGGASASVEESVNVTRLAQNTAPDKYGRIKTKSIGNRNANMSEFGYNLYDKRHVAIIVMASENAPEFDSTQTESLATELREIEQNGRQQGSDNRLIIVIPSDKCRNNIMKCFDQADHPIASVFLTGSFYNRFVQSMEIEKGKEIMTVNPESTMVLAPPSPQDICRLLLRTRMETGLEKKVDWVNLDDICEQLALDPQLKMTSLEKMLREKSEYTYKAFAAQKVVKRGEDLKSLNDLIGLSVVKDQIQAFIDRINLKRSRGEDIANMNKHMVFYGNPGTGKTTVARIVAGVLKDLGLVTKGHLVEVSREHLVAGYVGQTAIQTRQVIDSALDGVLFVDEAYRLADGKEDTFGREALNTLLARMENDRHRLVVILAGYEEDMEKVYAVNAGIKSRINTYLNFEDYSADELKKIFLLSANKYYTITPEVDNLLDQLMEHVVNYKKRRYEEQRNKEAQQSATDRDAKTDSYQFGNGRWVRNLMEKLEEKVAARFRDSGDASTLMPEDFEGLQVEELDGFVYGKRQEEAPQEETALEKLEKMVGLEQMKTEVRKIVKQARFYQMCAQQNKPVPEGSICRHMVFLGNPGTGKTTVARIMADIYYELGLLQKRTIIEVDRKELVAQYQGQTAVRVNTVFDAALGGVLFIDEAYALVHDQHDTFGREALDTLVKRIEDDRDKLVVIMAGYDREMREFIARNTGLKSRFSTYVHFEDYTPEQMTQIVLGFLHDRELETPAEVEQRLAQFINSDQTRNSSSSGNGRWARTLAEQVFEAYTSYCVDTNTITAVLTVEIIDNALQHFLQTRLN